MAYDKATVLLRRTCLRNSRCMMNPLVVSAPSFRRVNNSLSFFLTYVAVSLVGIGYIANGDSRL